MPLIVICGFPSSGKSTRSDQLQSFFISKNIPVHLINDSNVILSEKLNKNDLYTNSQKEIHLRSILKSDVIRNFSDKELVIFDALNYIKGYRYELYCAAKANKNTHCVIYCEINQSLAWEWNIKRTNSQDQYSEKVFNELIQRFEFPESRNRWDFPLFTIQSNDSFNFDAIFDCLFNKLPPKPNMSTLIEPKVNSNLLKELGKVTNDILNSIYEFKKMGLSGVNSDLKINSTPITFDVSTVSVQKLMSLRHSFLNFSKLNKPDNSKNISSNFLQFLNSSLQE